VRACILNISHGFRATRLSEDPSRIVGVIEAGQHLPDDPLIYTPGEYSSLFRFVAISNTIKGFFGRAGSNPKYDWMLTTTPQVSRSLMEYFGG